MKKSSKILLSLVVVIAALAVTYRMVNRAPSPDLPVHEQLLQVLEDGGCADCHTANPELPFYATMPLAKGLIAQHVREFGISLE